MELTWIVFQQTVTMALYMAMGYLLYAGKKISAEGSKSLAAILLWLVIPAVIINSFCVERTGERVQQLLVSTALGTIALAAAIAMAKVLFPKSPVDNFAAAFSNAGFMGIPLVRACFGDDAVFYLVGFVSFLNLLQWTYGASVLSRGKAHMGWKQILLNPISVGLFVGLVVFFAGLGTRLPQVVQSTVKGISSLNGPLAMVVLGVYLGQSNLAAMLTNKVLYKTSAVRLVLVPLVTAAILWLVPAGSAIRLAVLAAACAPVGSNVAVYAQVYGEDYPYACQTVAMSTLFSIVTMPFILTLGGIIL